MLEQSLLAERFQALLEIARQAEGAYAELAGKVTDPVLREELEQIRRDKHRHVLMTERLLEIVE
ncbi:unnamed protein product [marine sediment metagenome]|uniref:Rubrerythrin diiron-binding domain-containing protein n=1 Tax=marine sediment metagenome TaxID=412755 RepID=X0XRV9_9ZZZZ